MDNDNFPTPAQLAAISPDADWTAKVDWRLGCANSPDLVVTTSTYPDFDVDAPIWNWHDGLVWAQIDGWVEYIYMGDGMVPHEQGGMRGFGGAHFTRRLRDGTVVESNNCWSSRCSQLPIAAVEVVVVRRRRGSEAGQRYSGALIYPYFKELVHDLGLHLVGDWQGKPVEISILPDTAQKPTCEGEDLTPSQPHHTNVYR